MRQQLLSKINELGKEYYQENNKTKDQLNKAIFLTLNYVQQYPSDIDFWLLLAVLESNPPLEDPYMITKYVLIILSSKPTYVPALLVVAWAHHILLGYIDHDIYTKLCYGKSDNNEHMSMLELAKSYYFESLIYSKRKSGQDFFSEYRERKKNLELSVSYYSGNARNLIELAEILHAEGNITQALQLSTLAAQNRERLNIQADVRVPNAADIENVYDYFR